MLAALARPIGVRNRGRRYWGMGVVGPGDGGAPCASAPTWTALPLEAAASAAVGGAGASLGFIRALWAMRVWKVGVKSALKEFISPSP
mmetsp:Transcript_63594/g.170081  ORF Transcript_63594/g.170081 Transcript_63594/m.170081 type:complete len:88 (-) Transcript_63594:793-1056(-)